MRASSVLAAHLLGRHVARGAQRDAGAGEGGVGRCRGRVEECGLQPGDRGSSSAWALAPAGLKPHPFLAFSSPG